MAMQNGRFVYLKYRNFTSRVVDEPGAAHPTKPTPSKPPRPSLGKQTQQKLTHDYHAKHREIQADNSVYVKDVKRAKSWIPGTIIGRTGPVSAKVQLNPGEIIRRHQDHIRIRTDPDPTPQGDGENQDIIPLEIPLVPSDGLPTQALQNPASQSPAPLQPSTSEVERQQATSSPTKRRSTRTRQRPKRFGDYEVEY